MAARCFDVGEGFSKLEAGTSLWLGIIIAILLECAALVTFLCDSGFPIAVAISVGVTVCAYLVLKSARHTCFSNSVPWRRSGIVNSWRFPAKYCRS